MACVAVYQPSQQYFSYLQPWHKDGDIKERLRQQMSTAQKAILVESPWPSYSMNESAY